MRLLPPLMQLVRPDDDDLAAIAQENQDAPFTYPDVGATRGELPDGWTPDEQVLEIGQGRDVWARGIAALRSWVQFDLGWVQPLDDTVPIKAGETFAFRSRQLGLWAVNVCRIAYVVDEKTEEQCQFGFGYGTVGAHAVRGEEQFLLQWNCETDVVTFSIRKFSLPNNLWVQLAGPVARWVQTRFTREALARLKREVVR